MTSLRTLLLLVLGGLAGCETTPPPAPFSTAEHTPLPLVDGNEGVVLTRPAIVTITFPGYIHKDAVEGFGDFVVQSKWLREVSEEYGVVAATHASKVVWPVGAPGTMTDQGLRKMLVDAIADGTLPAPASIGGDAIYVVYVPSNVILDATSNGAGVLCFRGGGAFHSAGGPFAAGFHEAMRLPDGSLASYAVIGDCSGDAADVTAIASRELIGAMTNPYEVETGGYTLATETTDPWILNLDNGEVGYMCSQEPPIAEAGWTLRRSWSNREALANRVPCVPVPANEVYFNVSAKPAVTVDAAPGSTVTFQITGWSTGPTPGWTLSMEKPEGADLRVETLNASLTSDVMNNGASVTLSLTVPPSTRPGRWGGVNVVSGDHKHVWPVAFTVK